MTQRRLAPEGVDDAPPYEIHRRGLLYAGVGLVSLGLGVAFAALAATGEGPVWWYLPALVLAGLGLVHLRGTADARTPLLVADGLGLRLRAQRSWVGLPWSEVGDVRVVGRHGVLHDPYVKIITRDGSRVFTVPLGPAMTSSPAEAQVQLARRWSAAAY